MAKTAIVNPRKKRRRQPAQATNPRPRRRTYGTAATAPRRRRRRNPDSIGELAGRRKSYRRRTYKKNPDGMTSGNFGAIMEVLPAATAGDIGARWACKMAGEMEDGKPTFAHALAIWLAAVWGSPLVGNLFGDSAKGKIAGIGALSFGGSLFLRKHWLEDSDFGKENLYLGDDNGEDAELTEEDLALLEGLTEGSAIGDLGRRRMSRRMRPFLGAAEPQFYQTPDGNIVQMADYAAAGITPEHAQILADAGYGGLTEGSAIAGYGGFQPRRRSDAKSSFGYASE
jgi:hypothetical protein